MIRLQAMPPTSANTPAPNGFRQTPNPGAAQGPTTQDGLAALFGALMGSLADTAADRENGSAITSTSPQDTQAERSTSEQTAGDTPAETTDRPGFGFPPAAPDALAQGEPRSANPQTTAASLTTTPVTTRALPQDTPAAGSSVDSRQAVAPLASVPLNNSAQSQLQQALESSMSASQGTRDNRQTTSSLPTSLLNATAPQDSEHRPEASQGAARTTSGAEWAPVKVNTQHAQWSRDLAAALGERLNMQINQNVKEASVRLDPPDMGRIELTVRMDGDRLNIQLHASNNQVREMLSQHADRLRQDLVTQNTQTVDVQIGQHRHGRGSGQPRHEAQTVAAGSPLADVEDTDVWEESSDRWLSTSA